MHSGPVYTFTFWSMWHLARKVFAGGLLGQRLRAGLAWAPLPAESGVATGMVLRRLEVCAEPPVMLGGEVTPQQAFGDSRPLQGTQAMSTQPSLQENSAVRHILSQEPQYHPAVK